MNQVFSNVGGRKPLRSMFNLSHELLCTADMGILYPVQTDEVVPGDIWDHSIVSVVRCNPLVAPILHQIDINFHTFFVPYRLLTYIDDEEAEYTFDWEEFITGGVDGDDSQDVPTWDVTAAGKMAEGTLWDYLGFPDLSAVGDPLGAYPLDFPRQAYNMIYNQYYRDENVIAELAVTNEDLQLRSWEKDYFTSALPWQQRGTAPALPITGDTSAVWASGKFIQSAGDTDIEVSNTPATDNFYINNGIGQANALAAFNDNTVSLDSAVTSDINDLRLSTQIQLIMELNARGGVRYNEFLKAHFGVAPRDERLQRAEYIGGMKAPIVISEVLQTSESGATPQGTLAGHGISVDNNRIGRYSVKEYGLIMTIMSIMPKPMYHQGINKQWLRSTRYDFFFPEFVNLSEQAVLQAEIFTDNVDANNNTVFGFQGRYDEMRVKQNRVAGEMHSTFNYWHLCRDFGAAPTLNQTFLECDPPLDPFASQEDPQFIVAIGHLIKAVRPLPYIAMPGRLDH